MQNKNINENSLDIFDKIMSIGFLKKLQPFYAKNKEMLLYLFSGVLTTAVSFVTAGFSKILLENLGSSKDIISTVSTVFSWVCAVTFAYITNRIWVFTSTAKGKKSDFFWSGFILWRKSFYAVGWNGNDVDWIFFVGVQFLGY